MYADLLVNSDKLLPYGKYGISKLQGYDVIDVYNSLKLTLAYEVFKTSKIDEKSIAVLKKRAEENDSGITYYFNTFAPDEIIPYLENLDPDDPESLIKSMDIEEDFGSSEIWKKLQIQETNNSFLNYCLNVGNTDIDYWEKIYTRLNLIPDIQDINDRITVCINNKEDFQNSHLRRNQIVSDIPSDPKNEMDLATDNKKRTLDNKSNKTILYYALWFAFLIAGLFNNVFQKIALIIIALLVVIKLLLLYKSDMKKTERLYNTFILLILLTGIFVSGTGFYVVIAVLVSEAIKTFFLFKNSSTTNKTIPHKG